MQIALTLLLLAADTCIPALAFFNGSYAIQGDIFTAVTSAWPLWGGDLQNTRSVGTALVNQSSVAQGLTVAWEETLQGAVSASPFVYRGQVIVPTWAGLLYSLNSSTGATQWQKNITNYTTSSNCSRPEFIFGNTGLFSFSRTTPALVSYDVAVIGTRPMGKYLGPGLGLPYLIGLNITNGDLVWCTLADDQVATSMTMSGTAYRGDYFVGIASQQVAAPAYQITTFRSSFLRVSGINGTIKWRTWLGPPQEQGYSGISVWGSMPPIDPEEGLVFFGTGENYKVPLNFTACYLSGASSTEQCGLPPNYGDSLLALDIDDGSIRWANHLGPLEAFVVACQDTSGNSTRLNLTGYDIRRPQQGVNLPDTQLANYMRVGFPAELLPPGCPPYPGSDSDFSSAPILVECLPLGQKILLSANKGGYAFAVDPLTGQLIWATAAGPGGPLGGSMFGPASDGLNFYVGINTRLFSGSLLAKAPPETPAETSNASVPLARPSPGSPSETYKGMWVALDCASGEILWQTPSPLDGDMAGQLTVTSNGVLFGTTSVFDTGEAGLFAIDTTDGTILSATGLDNNLVHNGPSIVNDLLYQGTGYTTVLGDDINVNSTFWAFTVDGNPAYPGAQRARRLEDLIA